MTHSSSWFSALGRWQQVRRRLVALLPLAVCACGSKAPTWPPPHVGQETDFSFMESPERQIDILFVIDNSFGMGPKQRALANNFSRITAALGALPGGLPDLHIGVVSSDMGAGSEAIGSNCRVLGDRGLLWGNDPSNLIASVADGSPYATDPNHPLIASGCGLNLGQRWIEDIQTPQTGVGRQRNYDVANLKLEDVFSCLATAVGTAGCGYEHQLQALRLALNPQGLTGGTDVNMENNGFLRQHAFLAIVLLTDEDDCSADISDLVNDGMFLERPMGETGSLRCAARGHLCAGQAIPDYNDSAVGYTGSGFTHAFTDCASKAQLDPAHLDYTYMPLIDVQDMVDSVTYVKGNAWAQKILVSGIIGWPPDLNDPTLSPSVQTNDQYRIGKDATWVTASQAVLWDYMPICWDPAQTLPDGNIYKAYGGLRLKQFIDAFGPDGQTFSICNSDFSNALNQIAQSLATALASVSKPGCVQDPLIDLDPNTPNIIETDCQVHDRRPCDQPNVGGCQSTGYTENLLPECRDGQGNILDPSSLDPGPDLNNPLHPQAQINAVLATVNDASRPCWYVSYDNSALACGSAYRGQRISVLRPTGTVAPPGTIVAIQCLTCAPSEKSCPGVNH